MSCMKNHTETKKRRYTGQQPGTESGHRPTDKPWVNRGFCSPIGSRTCLA